MLVLIGRDMILLLGLLSFFVSQAITPTTPTKYESVDEEMRAYVDEAAEFLGFPENSFVVHVDRTSDWAKQSLASMGDSVFYIILFDREFAESQPQHIKKAIAGHEVGHAYPTCERLFSEYYNGHGTYLDSEGCADVVSSIIFGFEGMYAALIEIKRVIPTARNIDERIEALYYHLSPEALDEKTSREAEKEEFDLTPHP